jgi:hypothetical protein
MQKANLPEKEYQYFNSTTLLTHFNDTLKQILIQLFHLCQRNYFDIEF